MTPLREKATGPWQPVDEVRLEPLLSEYLRSGWRRDALELVAVHHASETGLRGVWQPIPGYTPPGGVFHLTAPLVMIAVSQLSIAYACLEMGLEAKPGETLLRNWTMECRRLVAGTRPFEIDLRCRAIRRSPGRGWLISGDFSVADEAFLGSGSFFLPAPNGLAALS